MSSSSQSRITECIGPVLEIRCGAYGVKGYLYLRDLVQAYDAFEHRLRLVKNPCIAYRNLWLNPCSFLKVGKKDHLHLGWTKVIQHHGVTIRKLLEEEVIQFNPPGCLCDKCPQSNRPPKGQVTRKKGKSKETSATTKDSGRKRRSCVSTKSMSAAAKTSASKTPKRQRNTRSSKDKSASDGQTNKTGPSPNKEQMEAVYLCENCEMTFNSRLEYLQHKKDIHPDQFENYSQKIQGEVRESAIINSHTSRNSTPENQVPSSRPAAAGKASITASNQQTEAVYLCENCEMTFNTRLEYLHHKKDIHPDQFENYSQKIQGEVREGAIINSDTGGSSTSKNQVPSSRSTAAGKAWVTASKQVGETSLPSINPLDLSNMSVTVRLTKVAMTDDLSELAQRFTRATRKRSSTLNRICREPTPPVAKRSKTQEVTEHRASVSLPAVLDQYNTNDILAALVSRADIFPCECGMLYRDRALYYLHNTLHHQENPQKCGLCGYEAKSYCDFHAHYYDHHNPSGPKETNHSPNNDDGDDIVLLDD